MNTSATTTSAAPRARPRRPRPRHAVTALALIVTAVAAGWLAHGAVFHAPKGELIDRVLSPSGARRLDLYLVGFGAGATSAWRAEVVDTSVEAGDARQVYLGPRPADGGESDVRWLNEDVVVINRYRVDTAGPGVGPSWMMPRWMWLVAWALVVGAAVTAAGLVAAGVAVARAFLRRRETAAAGMHR